MQNTFQPSEGDVTACPLYIPTVLKAYDGRCIECGRLERNATTEFSKCCDELLIDVRQYELAEIQ